MLFTHNIMTLRLFTSKNNFFLYPLKIKFATFYFNKLLIKN